MLQLWVTHVLARTSMPPSFGHNSSTGIQRYDSAKSHTDTALSVSKLFYLTTTIILILHIYHHHLPHCHHHHPTIITTILPPSTIFPLRLMHTHIHTHTHTHTHIHSNISCTLERCGQQQCLAGCVAICSV